MTLSQAKEVIIKSMLYEVEHCNDPGYKRKIVGLASGAGTGKSDIMEQAAEELDGLGINWYSEFVNLTGSDGTDLGFMPWVQNCNGTLKAEFVPFSTLERMINCTDETLFVFDEVGSYSPLIQSYLMQVFLLGEVKGHKFSKHAHFAF